MKQEFWIIRLTMPDGNVGYMNFKHDVTTNLKYVATWFERGHAIADLSRHIKNTSCNNSEVKYWIREGAKVDYVKLIMEVKE